MSDNMSNPNKAASYEDDPVSYLRSIYADALEHNNNLKDINKSNREFYEGIDDKLDERANNVEVERSALFVHELKPAIDTRVSDVVVRTDEREYPVTFRPKDPTPTNEEKEQAAWIEKTINEQLRDCGYPGEVFRQHIISAEIYRSPGTVKVGWENVYEKEAVVQQPGRLQQMKALLQGRTLEPRVVFRDKYVGGKPYVELMDPDEFLYEPNVPRLEDCEYAGHQSWESWDKLMSMAMAYGWDVDKLKANKEEMLADDTKEGGENTIQEEVSEDKGVPIVEASRNGKILVFEVFVSRFDEYGSQEVRQIIFIANKHIVYDEFTPYRGVMFPFVTAVANQLPNCLEGLSSVDVGKGMQRLYNEVFNSFLDGVSYRLFPPLVREAGTEFLSKPKWTVGAIFDVNNPDGLRPLIQNPGPMPELSVLMQAVSAKIRDTLNAQDISQGFQAQEYEKATSTNLRAQGAAKRSAPVNKTYGEALVKVATMVLALNQQYHEQGHRFVMPVVIDVPSLTSISDPETEKQEALLLLSQAQQSPVYQTPTGMLKIRNLTEDMIRKFKKIDALSYVPSEEELMSDMRAQRAVQAAALEKQNAQEAIGMEAQMVEQETTGG